MKTTLKLLIIFILMTSCFKIQMMPKRLPDDGTSSLTEPDKFFIHEFGSYNHKNKFDGKSYHYEQLNTSNFKQLSKASKYTWYIMFAPWCPHSSAILNMNSKTLSTDLSNKHSLKTYAVSMTYDLKNNQKMLLEAKYPDNIYILDSREFGTKENQKAYKLATTLFYNLYEWSNGTPQSFVVDSNLNLVLFKRGDLTNLDTVLKYIKLYESNK
ncbi:MAG: hypothetical protein ACK45U_09055 [bacterium]|jgi:hypothetical protein